MTTFDSSPMDRRALLGIAGALALVPPAASPAESSAVAEEARPRHAEAVALFARAHARLDGKPAFWLSRGREYGFIEGRYEQTLESRVVNATRALTTPQGGLKVCFCEASYAAAPGESEPRAELPSPLAGQSQPNPPVRLLKITWNVSPTALISARVETANVQASYEGRIDTQLGPDGRALVDCLVRVDTRRGALRRLLTEVGPYAADWPAERRGFVPASRTLTVCRSLPEDSSGGQAGVMLGLHVSRKYERIDGLRRALTAIERREFRGWFDAWEPMLLAPEEFLMRGT